MSPECPQLPSLVLLRHLLNLKRVVLKDDSSEWHCPAAQEQMRLQLIPILTPAPSHHHSQEGSAGKGSARLPVQWRRSWPHQLRAIWQPSLNREKLQGLILTQMDQLIQEDSLLTEENCMICAIPIGLQTFLTFMWLMFSDIWTLFLATAPRTIQMTSTSLLEAQLLCFPTSK